MRDKTGESDCSVLKCVIKSPVCVCSGCGGGVEWFAACDAFRCST